MSYSRFLWPLLLATGAFAEITVYHTVTSVPKGTTRQFTAYVPHSPNTVVWSVNSILGGNATYGTVSATGLYAAPAVVPPANVVFVAATSTAYPTISGKATVTITQPQPYVWSVNPRTVAAGAPIELSLGGQDFVPGAAVTVNNLPFISTFISKSRLTARGIVPGAGTYAVRVANPSPGALTSEGFNITVTSAAPPQSPPPAVTALPATVSVALGQTQQFTSNSVVTWTATAGSISSAGLFTAPAVMPSSPIVTIRATSTTDNSRFAIATVTLPAASAPPSPALLSAARLLEQAGFGPTPQSLSAAQAMPAAAWIDGQLNLPETAIPIPADMAVASAQILNRLATAPDQLRQRVAWALGQIIVISGNKNNYPNEYIPHLQLLSKHAFGNYRALLKDVTLSPQMGKYLDLANSNKPGVGGGANENFPRELLQLFSMGLTELNIDGSPKSNNPTYTQNDVRQFALALTGWTYPTAPGATPGSNNWENFSQPAMEPRQANHDQTSKTLLNGVVLPAGQTVQQDLEGVIDCVFNHPNVGPFVATRLIRHLVMSNPSPAFIARIAQIFNNNGTGVRGDLKAVVRAILLDPEARQDAAAPNGGRLKDPVYAYVSFVRAMGGSISPATQIAWLFDRMGQAIAAPPSVFGYYSPNYRMPGNAALFGPEFQIYTPTESVLLGNEFHQILASPNGDPSIDLAPFNAVAGDINQLLDLVNQRLFYGRMPAGLRASLTKATQASYDHNQRVFTALYLSALSGLYAVQY